MSQAVKHSNWWGGASSTSRLSSDLWISQVTLVVDGGFGPLLWSYCYKSFSPIGH